jgi:general secretion pathway protein L
VVVAGKAAVNRHLELAEKHGIAPKIIDYGEDAAAATELNLFQQRDALPVRGRGLIQGLLLLLTVGAVTSGAVGLMGGLADREALTWVEDRHSLAEQRAVAARRITGQAARLETRYRLPSDEKIRRQPKVVMLEALTRVLPDGTWLQRLEINNDDLRLVGQSRDAAALIALLETSPFFKNVRLAAPVTPVSGGEQFVIEGRSTEGLDLFALLNQPAVNDVGGTPPQSTKRRESEQ